jgi:hypothetical protein
MKYRITKTINHVSVYEVEAETEEDALEIESENDPTPVREYFDSDFLLVDIEPVEPEEQPDINTDKT